MKKLIILWLAIFGMTIAACTTTPLDETPILSQKPIRVTFKAQQVDENGTKTIRNADKTVSWMPSDEINIICGTDKGLFTSTNTENALLASFTGELTEATVNAINNGTNDPIWALYPYDENVVSDGNSVTTTLPANQIGIAGTFADDLFISLAKSNNFNLSFYNVCSGFKFSVIKAGITSITIQGKNNEDIAGKIKLSFGSDGKPKVDEVIEGQKTITLTPEKSTFEVGKDYYFVTLPIPFSSGFIVTFNTPSEIGTFEHSSSVSFPRSKFVTKSSIDAAVVYSTKKGNINIPDPNFKAYCVENFDKDDDEEISYTEALLINYCHCGNRKIKSMTGIEFFSNLKQLSCDNNLIDSLDLSYNPALDYLDCGYNKLTFLDVRNCSALFSIQCNNNQLTTVDVNNNTLLTSLLCGQNKLSSLIVKNNTKLTQLVCYYNQLSELDVSNNLVLTFLTCFGNQISVLDVSNNTELVDLACYNNKISELNISNNTKLTTLQCRNNQISVLDISHNTDLTSLSCSHNQISALDISHNTALKSLNCDNNQISVLVVSHNTDLTSLNCSHNQISVLDISHNTYLKTLACDSNSLPSLEVSKNTALTSLHCGNNTLSQLDVSSILALKTLECSNNALSELIVRNNTALTTLSCHHNSLSSLDVSNNSSLIELRCYNNQLSRLDVRNNTDLTKLYCYANTTGMEICLKTGQEQTFIDFVHDASAVIQHTD